MLLRPNDFILAVLLKMWFCAVLPLLSSLGLTSATPSAFHAALNENSTLFWTIDYKQKQVQFEVHVNLNTSEWLAVGFSNYGELQPSDLCVFWVDWHKRINFQDAWSDDEGVITVDESQDCKNFKMRRSKRVVKYTFSRKFDTCDPNDYIIEDGTTHIVWARGEGPLYSLNGMSLKSRWASGFQRTRLLQIVDEIIQPPDTWKLEVKTKQVKIPNIETTYWCKVIKLPDALKKIKHHIIQYEPAIENENKVHHMEVFHCETDANVAMPDYEGPCDAPERPKATQVCKHVIGAWAMGAAAFSYPKEAGLPIGGPDFNPYVMVEVHYHNPNLEPGVIDSSGIRFYLTKILRQFDAGVMELGLEYTDKMAIPPGVWKFPLSGYCIKECTAVSLPERGITVFGSQLHTHLTGVRVYTKHVREGVELPELNRDNHYSTHYQEIRRLRNPVKVLPGDALITTCEYRTTDLDNVTLGGFSITDEMCVNYIHYYPRTELEVCKSAISERSLANYFQFMADWEHQDTAGDKGISDKYRVIEWTPLRIRGLQELYDFGTLSMQCNQSSGDRFPGLWEGVANTKIQLPLPPLHRKCNSL